MTTNNPRNLPSIDPDLWLQDARERMFHSGSERLVVADREGVLGEVSRGDLDAAEAAGAAPTQPVRSIVTRAVRRRRSTVRMPRPKSRPNRRGRLRVTEVVARHGATPVEALARLFHVS